MKKCSVKSWFSGAATRFDRCDACFYRNVFVVFESRMCTTVHRTELGWQLLRHNFLFSLLLINFLFQRTFEKQMASTSFISSGKLEKFGNSAVFYSCGKYQRKKWLEKKSYLIGWVSRSKNTISRLFCWSAVWLCAWCLLGFPHFDMEIDNENPLEK